ncbi:MAG: fibronectin type III domain-containing protein, partial [Owenweeksia sp.]
MRTFLFILWGSLCISFAQGQSVATSATYTAGIIDTEFSSLANKNTSNNSGCMGTLNVPVPSGRYVTSVDVTYQGEAVGTGWISEQFSYLECASTGNKESAVSSGGAINGPGVFIYNRAGLSIANGPVQAGGIDFNLHAFRTFATNPSCSNQANRIKNNSWVITVHHIPPPSCLSPTNITVTNIQSNSADINWLSGGAANWQLEYGPAGFTPGSGTWVNVSSNPHSITGLSSQTTYEFRLRDSCGTGDVSAWTSIRSFRTGCTTIMAPWTENFSTVQWSTGPNFNSRGTIDTCWERNWNSGFIVKTGPPLFASNFSGPSGDHTSGSGKYLFSELIQFNALPLVAQIESPLVDLSALTVPELTFWYHMFGFNVEELKVEISDNNGGSWSQVFIRSGQLQTAKTDPWKEVIVNLSAYTNKIVKLRFTITQTAFGNNGDVAIDDVSIHEAPSCPRPQDPAAIFTWSNRAMLGWTSGGASNWQLQYGAPGFTLGSGTFVGVNSNPGTLSGLTPNTTYEVYVRDSCGPGNVSQWTGPLKFKTRCSAFGTPYIRRFEGIAYSPGPNFNDTGTINPCWHRDNLTSYVWKGGPPPFTPFNTGPDVDHTFGTSSGKYAFTQAIGFVGTGDRITNFQSSIVDLTALNEPQLSFWYHMFGSDIVELSVRISGGNGLWNVERVISGQQQTAKADPWTEVIVDLSPYAGDSIIVEWRATALGTGTASHIAIDDVVIDEAPSCPKPQNFEFLASSNNSVTLDWIPGGTATFWNIEYGPPGFSQGNGTLITATSNPFTITGLSANSTYDFYIRDSCGVGDVSVWIGPVVGVTQCNPISAPWSTGFEGPAFTIGTFTVPGNIPNCWSRTSTGNYIWTAGQGGTPSFNTGPDVDHTLGTSSGKFLYSEAFFGSFQTIEGQVSTPLIDLTPLNVPEFSFWYHMFGQEIDSLVVQISDGTMWKSEKIFIGQQQSSNSDPWMEAILDLSAYAGDTIQIRFKAHKMG